MCHIEQESERKLWERNCTLDNTSCVDWKPVQQRKAKEKYLSSNDSKTASEARLGHWIRTYHALCDRTSFAFIKAATPRKSISKVPIRSSSNGLLFHSCPTTRDDDSGFGSWASLVFLRSSSESSTKTISFLWDVSQTGAVPPFGTWNVCCSVSLCFDVVSTSLFNSAQCPYCPCCPEPAERRHLT